MQRHSCGQSTLFEALLFDNLSGSGSGINSEDKDLIPNEDCCICLLSLKEDAPKETGCCGRYARKTNCGHWMHVSCLVSSPTKKNCPICRADLFDNKLMDIKSQRSKIYNTLPKTYQNMYLRDGAKIFLNQEVRFDLEKNKIDAQYVHDQLQLWDCYYSKST